MKKSFKQIALVGHFVRILARLVVPVTLLGSVMVVFAEPQPIAEPPERIPALKTSFEQEPKLLLPAALTPGAPFGFLPRRRLDRWEGCRRPAVSPGREIRAPEKKVAARNRETRERMALILGSIPEAVTWFKQQRLSGLRALVCPAC